MPKLLALWPLAGFFCLLAAAYCLSRAREAGVDADLQRRLGEHSRRQLHQTYTPFEVARALLRQKVVYSWLCAALTLLAVLCFGAATLWLRPLL